MYKHFIRPMLFTIDAERVHLVAEQALRIPMVWQVIGAQSKIGDGRLRIKLPGLSLPSPVGIAAGFDKNCINLPSLLELGFGFATGGTVTLSERPGNSKPRMMRVPERKALINSLGFPNHGLHRVSRRIKYMGDNRNRIFVSISGTIEDEIVHCYQELSPRVAGIEINISSPNTAGLRVFHDPARLRRLIESIRINISHNGLLLVKLPPWTTEKNARKLALALAETAVSAGADGVVVANTIPIEDSRLAAGKGGMSGAPLLENTVRMTAEISALLGKKAVVIACGGVSSAEDVWRLIASGATATQLYTALVYEGPGLAGAINRSLLKMMEEAGVDRIRDISGPPPIR